MQYYDLMAGLINTNIILVLKMPLKSTAMLP